MTESELISRIMRVAKDMDFTADFVENDLQSATVPVQALVYWANRIRKAVADE